MRTTIGEWTRLRVPLQTASGDMDTETRDNVTRLTLAHVQGRNMEDHFGDEVEVISDTDTEVIPDAEEEQTHDGRPT